MVDALNTGTPKQLMSIYRASFFYLYKFYATETPTNLSFMQSEAKTDLPLKSSIKPQNA